MEFFLRQLIASSPATWVGFAEVMRQALYHPEHGYYSGTPKRIGRAGDFYTAVSVGPLYGRLLAAAALEAWESCGQPAGFTIIEQAAHDGQLAADLMAGLQGTPLGDTARFCIVEPQEAYRDAQQHRLQPALGDRISWVTEVSALPPGPGFFVCNELLDAFPVHRVRWTGEQWQELGVTVDAAGELTFESRPIIDVSLAEEVSQLPTELPTGYTTEIHPAATEWMRNVCASGFDGSLLVADYGYEASEYYTPERADGTLRRYFQHQVDGEVLKDLGKSDLTAHINFSRVISDAQQGGFEVKRFMEQGRFLTHAAKSWLTSLEGKVPTGETIALLRQFQSLTHPGHMGAAFRMLLLERKFR